MALFILDKMDKHIKNVGLGIISFLVVFIVFKLTNIIVDAIFWLITLLLLLIYFELWDLSGESKEKR